MESVNGVRELWCPCVARKSSCRICPSIEQRMPNCSASGKQRMKVANVGNNRVTVDSHRRAIDIEESSNFIQSHENDVLVGLRGFHSRCFPEIHAQLGDLETVREEKERQLRPSRRQFLREFHHLKLVDEISMCSEQLWLEETATGSFLSVAPRRILTGQLSMLLTMLNRDRCFSVFPRSSFSFFATSRSLSKESISS